MAKNVILIHKPVGKTPLDAVKEYKKKHPELLNEKIGYAGRLDPMADGLLLLLVGDENKNKDKYLLLPKVYEAKIVFGISTDSYDLLGLVQEVSSGSPEIEEARKVVNGFVGVINQPPPPYSSYRIDGKPLFYYSKNKVELPRPIPKIERTILEANVIDLKSLTKDSLREIILSRIALVNGDFRQDEIIEKWEEFFSKTTQKNFTIITCHFSVSSGTYIRSIAHEIGVIIGIPSFALSITRTKIGDFELI